MVPLHRHQIARLSDAGWRRVLDRQRDPVEQDCLAYWAARRLPLVVTRQSAGASEDALALGLPAPQRWRRRRLAIEATRSDVMYFDEFPRAELLPALLPAAARPAWRRLCARLQAAGVSARVYGSFGWQLLSGLDHLRAGSDIDIWLSVSDLAQADAAAACLQAAPAGLPRLDGELMFDDGAAVAWREWPDWRSGRVRSLLVKTIAGSSLLPARGGQAAPAFAEAA